MPKRALVIGSGFGGMAAALRARKMGFNVTLIERLDQLGGRARTFECDGHVFDAGPTVITAPFLFDELFELFGRRLTDYAEILPVSLGIDTSSTTVRDLTTAAALRIR